MWKELKKIIRQNRRFILTTHLNPDGDGIGAATALTELLLAQDKEVKFLAPNAIPNRFSFLDFHKTHRVFSPKDGLDDSDVLIVLDAHTLERLGALGSSVSQSSAYKVCIDHHIVSDCFADLAIIDTESCSVGAMIYTLCKESGYSLNLRTALGIYTSVICDTGRFSYSSTSRKAHKIADECIKVGVDPSQLYSNLFQQVPEEHMDLFLAISSRREVYCQHKLIIQSIHLLDCSSLGVPLTDLEFIHEFHKLNSRVECVIILQELGEQGVRVSMRSKCYVDVGEIMKVSAGGGHNKAAGAVWRMNLERAKEQVLALLEPQLNGAGVLFG